MKSPDSTGTEPIDKDFSVILASAKEGSKDAFGILYSWLHARILAFCKMHVGQDGPDAASETWISIAKSIRNFEGSESEFRSWAITIAHRRCIDWIRKSPSFEIDNIELEFLGDTDISNDPQQLVTTNISAQDILARISATLPEDQRNVLFLRVIGGLSSEEVANIIGKRSGAVRMLLHRAIKSLSSQVEDFLEISSEEA